MDLSADSCVSQCLQSRGQSVKLTARTRGVLCGNQMDDTCVAALVHSLENYVWDVFGNGMGFDLPQLNCNKNEYFDMQWIQKVCHC